MRFILFLSSGILLFVLSCSTPLATERFEGKMVYKLSSDKLDRLATDSMEYQIIYAKDSLLRIENFTPIGKQVYIKHIPKNRAYILLDFEWGKFAIQSIPEEPINAGKYQFKKKRGKINICGIEAKQINVTIPNIDSTVTMLYHPKLSADYSEAIPGIPGMPLRYALLVNDIFTTFELVSFEEKMLPRDLFGIPSDYKIVTMDEFIELIKENQEEPITLE